MYNKYTVIRGPADPFRGVIVTYMYILFMCNTVGSKGVYSI